MERIEDEDDEITELCLQVLAKIQAMDAIFVDLTAEEIENIQYVLDGSDDELFDVEGDTIPGLQALGSVTVTDAQVNEGDTNIHSDVPSTMVETSAADNELDHANEAHCYMPSTMVETSTADNAIKHADNEVIPEVHRSPTTPTAAKVDEEDSEAHCFVPSTMVEMPTSDTERNHIDDGALSRIHGRRPITPMTGNHNVDDSTFQVDNAAPIIDGKVSYGAFNDSDIISIIRNEPPYAMPMTSKIEVFDKPYPLSEAMHFFTAHHNQSRHTSD